MIRSCLRQASRLCLDSQGHSVSPFAMRAFFADFLNFSACLVLMVVVVDQSNAQSSFLAANAITQANTQRIEEALQQIGSVDFVENPLQQVVETMQQQFGVQIVLARRKLEEASVSPDTPITRTLSRLPLESLLRRILDDIELSFTIRDDVILISTPEDIESQLITRVYPVLDLATDHDSTPTNRSPGSDAIFGDYDSLIEVITSTLKPDSWDDVGGPGGVDLLPNAAALVVSQTRDVHQQIEHLLIALRRAKSVQGIRSVVLPAADGSAIPNQSLIRRAQRIAPSTALPWQRPQTYAAGN